MSVPFHQSGRAHRILEELQAVIEHGYEKRALQRSPHLVLLNFEWYHEAMRPVMAQWMMLWLEANHCAGLASDQVEAYITSDGALVVGTAWEPWVHEAVQAKDEQAAAAARAAGAGPEAVAAVVGVRNEAEAALKRLHAYMERRLDAKAFKMLNLAAEWLRTYLPHVLQKIDRVSFGLLSMQEYQRLMHTEPHMPRSRFKLAVPFVGKDVPSRASEFAHPDIIIGLTVLAYRYEASGAKAPTSPQPAPRTAGERTGPDALPPWPGRWRAGGQPRACLDPAPACASSRARAVSWIPEGAYMHT